MATDIQLKENLSEITERIVDTYGELPGISHLAHCPLPQYQEVIAATEDIKEILYPGFRRREGLHLANVGYYVGDLVDRLHDSLTKQIGRALRHEANRTDPCGAHGVDYEALGQKKAVELLRQLPELRAMLAKDVQAAFDGDPAVRNPDEIVFCYPGLEAITVHRVAHRLHQLDVPFIPRMMAEWSHSKTGIDIHPGAQIGEYFFIDHGTGVVIGETCEIGDHVKIYQGVTLGALSFATDADGQLVRGTKRHPTIQDHVVIYANATILGGHTVIGHDSVIGSSVWLTNSVSPRTTVVLERPRLKIRAENAQPSDISYDI